MSATPVIETIRQIMAQAVESARSSGALRLETMPDIQVERPGKAEHGDFASSLPLRLARATRINPLELAQTLAALIPACEPVERVETAPPGFINFHLKDAWLQQQVEAVRQAGAAFGNVNLGQGRRVMVEFVSANPTGPVHVGHTRGAVLGSALAQVLQAAGYSVTREFYVNDAGSQMEAFYRSLYARYRQTLGQDAQLPPNGYQGEYVTELAQSIIADADADAGDAGTDAANAGRRFLELPEVEAVRALGGLGRERMVGLIRDDLAAIGVEFDNWFSEQTLFQPGESASQTSQAPAGANPASQVPASQYDAALGLLRSQNYLSEREEALWFNSSMLGDEKDNVVVRSSGEPTYFASDIAYHYNKFVAREFDSVINIWGADHQGHVPRMKAAVQALGVCPDRLTILISQMVTLKRGAEVVRASKRAGEFVTLRELAEEVGRDACRFFFLSRTPSTQMEFDLELAKKESAENPVYYVQYAHARNAGILNLARSRDIDWSGGAAGLLTHPSELGLIRAMLRLPELVQQMARTLEPHHLAHYTMELATAFHLFYENCRVLSANPEDGAITLARLKLVESAQIVFRRALELMGMSAPEQM